MDTKNRIKELMDERGWTIYELSKRSGLAQTTISNMWKRNTEPTIPSLRALCNGFGITLAQFFAEGVLQKTTVIERYVVSQKPYGTTSFSAPSRENGADAKPYIKTLEYPIPLNYAYPTFGWGVKFENKKFVSIVAEDYKPLSSKEQIRVERPTFAEIIAVKELIENKLGKSANENILYHLDDVQLKNYTDHEISQILAY